MKIFAVLILLVMISLMLQSTATVGRGTVSSDSKTWTDNAAYPMNITSWGNNENNDQGLIVTILGSGTRIYYVVTNYNIDLITYNISCWSSCYSTEGASSIGNTGWINVSTGFYIGNITINVTNNTYGSDSKTWTILVLAVAPIAPHLKANGTVTRTFSSTTVAAGGVLTVTLTPGVDSNGRTVGASYKVNEYLPAKFSLISSTAGNVSGTTITKQGSTPFTYTVKAPNIIVPNLAIPQLFCRTYSSCFFADEFGYRSSLDGTGDVVGQTTVWIIPSPTIVSIADAFAATNSSIVHPIMVENVTNIAAGTITLTYDPKVINVLSVSSGDLGAVITNIDNNAGSVSLSAFSTIAKNGDILFANILLKTVGSSNVTSPLALAVRTIVDQNGVSIPYLIRNGVFTISTAKNGDVNEDGIINIVDALFIAQSTVGLRAFTSTQSMVADVSRDGLVNIVDALFIAQASVGLRQL